MKRHRKERDQSIMAEETSENLVNEYIGKAEIRRRLSLNKITTDMEKNNDADPLIEIQPSCCDVIYISVNRFQFKLYFVLFLSQLLPTVYKSIRIYYLGNLPNSSGVDIASQLVWVNLILEVFQESLLLPLYCLIGDTLTDINATKNKVKTGIILTFVVYVILSAIIASLAYPLTKLMAQNKNTIKSTVEYVRLELISSLLESVNGFCMVIFTMLNKQRYLFAILIIRLVTTITLDTFFLNNWKYSLKLGVNGIAYGNIATSAFVFVFCLIFIYKIFQISLNDFFNKSTYQFSWLKNWFRIGFWSGVDSFVRNIFYLLCVIRMMNVIEEQGIYWRANEYIWNWLLLPFLPLSQLLKQDTGQKVLQINHKFKMAAYFIFTLFITTLWFITVPLWKLFFKYVMNINAKDVDSVYNLVLVLSPFYVVFMMTSLLNSVLYGNGRTDYLAIKSTIVNLTVFLTTFILFLLDVYKPDVQSIALLFGSAMLLGNILTYFFYYKVLKLCNYQI